MNLIQGRAGSVGGIVWRRLRVVGEHDGSVGAFQRSFACSVKAGVEGVAVCEGTDNTNYGENTVALVVSEGFTLRMLGVTGNEE